MSRQLIVRLLAVTVALSVSGVAQAKKRKQFKYVGGHPQHKRAYCHIDAPHVHVHAPARGNKKKIKLEYRVYDDHYHFVGDPVERGYDGDHHSYHGHHPIAVDVVVGAYVAGAPHTLEYCYLDGAHHHAYAPPADISFVVSGGVHTYVGDYPPEYEQDRPALVKINALYAPVVAVEAPVARAEVRGGVEVDVHIPAPSLTVEVGLPGVVVVDGHSHNHRKARKRKHKHKHFKRKHKKSKHKKRKHKQRKHKIKSVWSR